MKAIKTLALAAALSLAVTAQPAQAGEKNFIKVTGVKEIDRILFRKDPEPVRRRDTEYRPARSSDSFFRFEYRSGNARRDDHDHGHDHGQHTHGPQCGCEPIQRRVWVAEHTEIQTVRVVIPAHEERVYVPEVFEYRYDTHCRQYVKVVIRPAHYETRCVPERVEYQQKEVCVPGHYEYITVYE